MKEKQEKIKKLCRILNVITNLGRIVFCIYCGIFVIMGGLYLNFGNKVFDYMRNAHMQVSMVLPQLQEQSKGVIMLVLVLTLLRCICLVFVFHLGSKVFELIKKDGIPFKTEVAKLIQYIAIILFVSNLIPSVSELSKNLDTTTLVSSGNILPALILFAIAKVFEYGCELQKESDETL